MGDESAARKDFRGIDPDENGQISYERFVETFGPENSHIFEKYDVNGDGLVDVHERHAKQPFQCQALLLGVWPVLLFSVFTISIAFYAPTLLWQALAGY